MNSELFDNSIKTRESATGALPALEHEVIFHSAPVGICHMRGRTFIRCNRRLEELFGYAPGALDNQSVRLLYPSDEMFHHIGKEYGHFFERNLYYKDERPMLRRDGTLLWCIVTGKALDPSNPCLGTIWVVQDISEHKRIENELKGSIEKLELMVQQRTLELHKQVNNLKQEVATRKNAEELANENQQKYQKLFHMLPIGISITNGQGSIREANHVFTELVGSTGSVPTSWRQLSRRFSFHDGTDIPKERFPWLINDYQRASINNVEVGMREKKSGKLCWLSVSTSLLSIKDQSLVVAAFTDITYRKRIEELERLRYAELTRLDRINSMAGMATALAHQMGQPLVSALNYLHGCRLRLDRVAGIDEEIGSSIGLAIKHLEQAGEILLHVRNFVSKHQPEKVPEDIADVIADTLSFLNFEIHRNGVMIELALTPDLPPVPMCKVEIQQVLFNLMKNGMEAMVNLPQGQRVLIIGSEIAGEGRVVRVFVQDHGGGVEKGHAKRVFEPYFSTKPDGMGVGLTICRSIIESHGGELSFSKIGKQGSRFQFTLPM